MNEFDETNVKGSEIYYIVEIKNYFKIRKMPSLYCWKSIESITVLNDYQRLKTKNAHPIKNILGPKSTIFHNLYIFVIFWYKFRPFGKMVIKSSISNRFQPCYLKTKIIFQFVGSYLYTFCLRGSGRVQMFLIGSYFINFG